MRGKLLFDNTHSGSVAVYVIDFSTTWDRELNRWVAVNPEQQSKDKVQWETINPTYHKPDEKGVYTWTTKFPKGDNPWLYFSSKAKSGFTAVDIDLQMAVNKAKQGANEITADLIAHKITGKSAETARINIIVSKHTGSRVALPNNVEAPEDLGLDEE